jgi:hypothetical protein
VTCETCGGSGIAILYPETVLFEMAQYERAHPGVIICGTGMPHDIVVCGDCPAGDELREEAETLDPV